MLDEINSTNKDSALNLVMIRIAQSAYNSAERNLVVKKNLNNPFFEGLHQFILSLSGLANETEFKESARAAIILLSCMTLNIADLPASFLVEIMLGGFKHLGIDTKDKLRGALALADVLDPNKWITDPGDGNIH
jgi:hypothetical protein